MNRETIDITEIKKALGRKKSSIFEEKHDNNISTNIDKMRNENFTVFVNIDVNKVNEITAMDEEKNFNI